MNQQTSLPQHTISVGLPPAHKPNDTDKFLARFFNKTAVEENGSGSNATAGLAETISPAVLKKLEETLQSIKANVNKVEEAQTNKSGNDAAERALLVEKQRHEETRRTLNGTEARMELLLKEMEDRNKDLEEFQIDREDLEDRLETANSTIEELRLQVSELAESKVKITAQQEAIESLGSKTKVEEEARHLAEVEASISREALASGRVEAEVLRKEVLIGKSQLKEKQSEVEDLRRQLAEANKAIAAKDELLKVFYKDEKGLNASLFEARHQLEEVAAAVGETHMGLGNELSRFMNVLEAMRNSTTALPK